MKRGKRPSVPRNVERQLWGESCGFCMNPECLQSLISESTEQNIGVMAHIELNSKGGDVSADNLILLCANCHKETEPLLVQNGEALLREWKAQAIQRISQEFSEQFTTFELLEERVKPILERNYLIFSTYGPASNQPEKYNLWLKFESEVIANNSQLSRLLTRNLNLLHKINQKTVKEFALHVDEFVKTRADEFKLRELLFPEGLLSMFGIEPESYNPVQSVSALQNFIAQLQKEEEFIDLKFFPEPGITYAEDTKLIYLSLNDVSRVRQIYFNRYLYHPRKTELTLKSLMFFLEWLIENGIEWEFENYSDLTTLILNNKHRVKIFYIYCLSLNDLQKTSLRSGDHVVNLHMWNGGPLSTEAMKYASSLGVKIYNQNEFFVFCHNYVK